MSGLVYLCLPGLLAKPTDIGAQAKNGFRESETLASSRSLSILCPLPPALSHSSLAIWGQSRGWVLLSDRKLSLPPGLGVFSCQHPKLGSKTGSEKKPEKAPSTHSGIVALTQAFLFSFLTNCIECCFLCPELSMKK